MPHCEECGQITLDREAQFCVRCGGLMKQEDPPPEKRRQSSVVSQHEAGQQVRKKPYRLLRRVLAGVGGCLVVVVAFGFVLVVASSCITSDASETSSKTLFVSTEGEPVLIIKPSARGYDAARNLLKGLPTDNPGQYRVSRSVYESVEKALGIDDTPEDDARLERWKEQYVHHENVNAFIASTKGISADRVIDKNESARICFLLPQWESQLKSAHDYVVNYRNVEPDTVEKNPGLGNLQTEAERGLALLTEIECK